MKIRIPCQGMNCTFLRQPAANAGQNCTTKEAAGDRPDPSCAKAAKLNIVQFATTKPSYHPPAGSSVGLLYNEHGDALSSVKLQVKICSAQVFFAVL